MEVPNYLLDSFYRFYKEMFMLESFLFHMQASVRAAIHNIKRDLGTKELNEREILGKVSMLRDVTAKDDCSFVRNNFVYEVKAEEHEAASMGIVSRAALGTLADAVEFFNGFSKDIFVAILIYKPEFVQELDIPLSPILSSFDDTKRIVLQTKFTVAPFKRAAVGNASVRTFIHNKFPTIKKLSEKGNNMKTNYVKLMENLVQVRHAVTHDNGRFSGKPKADIAFLKKYMTIAEDSEGFVLLPTDEQINHLLDLVQEYAFLLTKQLCIELKLPWAHTTYSMQNEMEHWRSRFDLSN